MLGIRVIPTGLEATGSNESFVGGINAAILRYDGAKDVDPESNQTPNGIQLNEADLSVSCYVRLLTVGQHMFIHKFYTGVG